MSEQEARDDERGEPCSDECGWCGQNMPVRDAERQALIARAREVSGALEEYEFEGAAGEAAGLLNSLADALARKYPEPEITEAPDLSDPDVVYDLVNEHVTLPGVVEHARRRAEWCCEKGCGSGACESCPCCAAGACVSGSDFSFADFGNTDVWLDQWLEVAAEHNPLAAHLQAALRVSVGEGER